MTRGEKPIRAWRVLVLCGLFLRAKNEHLFQYAKSLSLFVLCLTVLVTYCTVRKNERRKKRKNR